MDEYKYILGGEDGHTPVPVKDVLEWGHWMEEARKGNLLRVGQDKVGDLLVSTVFLGIDHRFGDGDEPLIFETMVLDKNYSDSYCERCSTWAEAEEMHKRGIEEARKLLNE